jgi:arginine/ornithine N-succinyltransferase beta subunit
MKASSTVQQQLEDIANKRAKLKATMDSIQEERQARESKRTEITRLETEKTEKVAAKEAILAKIVTAKKEREESANRLQAARAAEEQIGELKGANDALENIQSTKDKFELEGLGKEKENSTRITTSMTENAAKTFEELSSKRNENASILQSLQEEHSRHQQDLEDKELKLINFKNCGETSLETSRKALEDHVKRKEQCRRDNEAQSERRASLIAEHIEAAEKNLPLVEEELAAREDFYTYAKSYVVESNKLRDKLAAKGIGL